MKQNPNSIGYVELIYAVQNKMSFGVVRNAGGAFVQADFNTVAEAAAGAAKNMPDDFRVSITNAPGKSAYPISTFTYVQMNYSVHGDISGGDAPMREGAGGERFVHRRRRLEIRLLGFLDYRVNDVRLPPLLELASPGWEAVVLVKPQFEAGRQEVRGGVVRDPETRRRVARDVADAALAWGAETAGIVDSGLPGPKGNRELFLHLVQRASPRLPAELGTWISDAVE